MKSALRTAAMAVIAFPACAVAQQNLSFSTSVDLNYKQMSLEATQVAGPNTISNTFSPTLWTLNVSPSLAWRGVFVSLGLERSLGEGSTSDYISNGTSWSDRRFTREENNLTLGYNVWAGLSLFVGQLSNRTEMTFTNYGIGGNTLNGYGHASYTEKGPYFGLGYSHRFAGGGSASVNYAYLKGSGNFTNKNPAAPSAFQYQSNDGDVTGSGFGVSWSAPLTGSLYYRLGYKGNRYTFDFSDQNGPRSTKQKYDSFFLGLANYF
jgi:hypothetical protein